MKSVADNVTDHHRSPLQYIAALAILCGLLAGVMMPWVLSDGAALTMGPYELAEWTSLRPEARETAPPLLTSLGFRLSIVGVSWLIMLDISRLHTASCRHTAIIVFVGALVSVAMLPPFEFYSSLSTDENYRQQMAVALIAFAGGVAISFYREKLIGLLRLEIAVTLGAFAAGIIAFSNALALIRQSGVAVSIGPGFWLFCLGFMLFVGNSATSGRIKRGEAQVSSPP